MRSTTISMSNYNTAGDTAIVTHPSLTICNYPLTMPNDQAFSKYVKTNFGAHFTLQPTKSVSQNYKH